MASSTQGGSCVKYIYPASVFFKGGLTIACWNSVSTFDVVRDAFIVAVISGTNSYEHCFSNHAGIGTNSGADATNRSTNTASLLTAVIIVYERTSPQLTMSFLMFETFSMK